MKFSKEIKAGLIAIVSILSFVYLVQFMKGKSLFTTDDTYYAKYDNVEGLQKSSTVSINGLKVGQVDDIVPITDKKGRIYFVVKLLVDHDYEFSRKSTVEIFAPGIMADNAVRINLAYGGPLAKDGDTLSGSLKLSMFDNLSTQVGPVKDQLQLVLNKVDSLTSNANKVLDDRNRAELRSLLINLNRTVSAFQGTSQQTNTLLTNNDPRLQRVLENANLATISARTAVDKYGTVAERINVDKLNETIDKLDQTANKLNSVVGDIQTGKGSLGKLTQDEELYNNLNESSKNLNDLILDLKDNPKRYLNFSVFGKNK